MQCQRAYGQARVYVPAPWATVRKALDWASCSTRQKELIIPCGQRLETQISDQERRPARALRIIREACPVSSRNVVSMDRCLGVSTGGILFSREFAEISWIRRVAPHPLKLQSQLRADRRVRSTSAAPPIIP